MSKLVLITGASSGIGQAMAWRYYQAGYSLGIGCAAHAGHPGLGHRKGLDCSQRFQIYSADVA
jgi:NAD(P)-dependent dehydrogenase (short-subunit alcohol dehydrogenase family)